MASTSSESNKRFGNIFHSIRFRLTLWTVFVLAVILLAFTVFIYFRQARDLQVQAQNNLVLKAQQIQLILRPAISLEPDGEGFNPPPLAGSGTVSLEKGQGLALVNPDGSLIQTVGAMDATQAKTLAGYWQQVSQNSDPVYFTDQQIASSHERWFAHNVYLITPLVGPRRWAGLLIMNGEVDPDGLLPRLLVSLSLGSVATLLFALLGGFWIASRAMAPVRVITRTARSIGDTDLHRRLNLKTKDELGELASTFDAMLARLEAAFDRQRQFTADASHELRTPLTIVGIETDHALERSRNVEEYERTLKVIQSENEYMSHLVNDLLVLARMDAGQTHMHLEPIDLSDLTLDVVERLSPLAAHAHTQLMSGELPAAPVLGDRQYLTQMLTNLIENAIKYSGGKNGLVKVETGVDVGRNEAWVQVDDQGPGIPPEDLTHIFDRFYRVDKARQRAEEIADEEAEPVREGSGLGLSIVQSIVQAHGGQVSVHSEPGKGTSFMVRLPLNQPGLNGGKATVEKAKLPAPG